MHMKPSMKQQGNQHRTPYFAVIERPDYSSLHSYLGVPGAVQARAGRDTADSSIRNDERGQASPFERV